MTPPAWAEKLAAVFPDAEIMADEDAVWVSVPMTHNVAVEVQQDGAAYDVWVRAWDRTGGMQDETHMARCATEQVAAYVVTGLLTSNDDFERSLDVDGPYALTVVP